MNCAGLASLIFLLSAAASDDGPGAKSPQADGKTESSERLSKPRLHLDNTTHFANASCMSCHTPTRDESFRNFQTTHSWLDVTRPVGAEGLGADLIPADETLRLQLSLPEGQGLVVSSVAPQSHAERCGLKSNDILLSLGDKPLHTAEELILHLTSAVQQATRPDSPTVLPLTLMRSGQTIKLQVQPEVRVRLAPVVQEKPEYYLGTPANPVDETLRAQLIVPQGTGLILGEIAKDSPAAKAGLQQNDILLGFDSKPVPDVDALRAAIQATEGKPARLQILRAGKPLDLTATPEVRKAATPSNWLFQDIQARDRLYWMDGNLVTVLANPDALTRSEASVQYRLADPLKTAQNLAVVPNPATEAAELTRKMEELNARLDRLSQAVEALTRAQVPGAK